MKQEPEEEENCYFEEEMSSLSSSSVHSSRVRSHAKSLRAMANPSAVWAHFDLCANDPLRAQCRICESVVVRGGANPRQCGTTNLHRHLRVHHGGRLVGRRYHVTESSSQGSSSNRGFRLNSREIQNAQKIQTSKQQQSKNFVLKTIPLSMKKNSPSSTIRMQQNKSPPILQPQQSTEVCLRWNSYHSNMQTSFPSLLDTEQFVDVTLACEGRSIKCHKMILSSCSDYLAELLRENPCQHPIILMKDLKYWEVEALVNFMYRGEVNVSHDKLPELLNAAEALQVKGLAEPSFSSQNQKVPGLIPKPTPTNSAPKYTPKLTETKEFNNKKVENLIPILPKIKKISKESSKLRALPKLRLRRSSMINSPSTIIKIEPLDIPLSPHDIYTDNHGNDDDDDDDDQDGKNLIAMQEENDQSERVDENIQFFESPGPPNINNDADEQMEFVPTDFLEQEQGNIEDVDRKNERNDVEEVENYNDDDVRCIDDDYDICNDNDNMIVYKQKDVT